VFSADLDHIHHCLLGIGWSHGATVMLLYGVGLFFSGLSVLLIFSDNPRLEWPVALFAAVGALGLSRWLGYLGPARGIDVAAQRKNILCRRALYALERQLANATCEGDIADAVADFEAVANQVLEASDSPLRTQAAIQAARARIRYK
jgi:hypothetical protein